MLGCLHQVWGMKYLLLLFIPAVCLFNLGFAFDSPLWAEECQPLTLITSVDMIPVKDDDAVLLPTKLNGSDVPMLLDTGAAFSEISQQAADRLKLDTRHVDLEMVGVSGDTSNVVAKAQSFVLGRLHASSMDFVVSKSLDHLQGLADGLFAANLLTSYDVELDFANHKFNLMSPDHCEGKVIYWPASAIAVVPISRLRSGHIMMPVVLDGVRMNALIDTGATKTTLSLPMAEGSFHLKVNTVDTPDAGDLGGNPNTRKYKHRFNRLDFGDIAVANPTVYIIPDLMKAKLGHTPPLGTRIRDEDELYGLPDLILGMDVLRHLHLYIAYRESKLYATPESASPPH